MYHCAQAETRQHNPKKGVREGAKQRDKGTMESFACEGWLHITVHDRSPVVEISLKHKEEHIPYWCIDVPPDIQEFVKNNSQLNTTQVCLKLNNLF